MKDLSAQRQGIASVFFGRGPHCSFDQARLNILTPTGVKKLEFSVHAAAALIELLKRQRDAVGVSLFHNKLKTHTQAKTSMAHHRYLYDLLEGEMNNDGLKASQPKNV